MLPIFRNTFPFGLEMSLRRHLLELGYHWYNSFVQVLLSVETWTSSGYHVGLLELLSPFFRSSLFFCHLWHLLWFFAFSVFFLCYCSTPLLYPMGCLFFADDIHQEAFCSCITSTSPSFHHDGHAAFVGLNESDTDQILVHPYEYQLLFGESKYVYLYQSDVKVLSIFF